MEQIISYKSKGDMDILVLHVLLRSQNCLNEESLEWDVLLALNQ